MNNKHLQQIQKIPFELLKSYDKSGPRYTSYPTANEFLPDYKHQDYEAALKKSSPLQLPISVYIHVPFCFEKCHFCGCTSFVLSDDFSTKEYVTLLKKELSMVFNHLGKSSIVQFHIGGGTPCVLNNELLEEILKALRSESSIEKNCELAIEINPYYSSTDQIVALAQLGFNRISIGLQDLNLQVLKNIGRKFQRDQFSDLLQTAKNNFESINFDLIYGLPGQTLESFSVTLDEVAQLKPSRIALYSFAYIPWIKANQKNLEKDLLPSSEVKFSLLCLAYEKLFFLGYIQIGMDHFALPDDELAIAASKGSLSRNFMGYTVKKSTTMLGFGASSIGYVDNTFFQNFKEPLVYKDSISKNILPIEKGYRLNHDDLVRKYVITELMCNFTLNFNIFFKLFQIDFQQYFRNELKQLKNQRYDEFPFTVQTDQALCVTDIGKFFIRNICMYFDSFLNQKNTLRPTFSRTI